MWWIVLLISSCCVRPSTAITDDSGALLWDQYQKNTGPPCRSLHSLTAATFLTNLTVKDVGSRNATCEIVLLYGGFVFQFAKVEGSGALLYEANTWILVADVSSMLFCSV